MDRWLVLLALTVGCTGDTPNPGDGVCVSDEFWTGGDEESPQMHPGLSCIQCHADRGEGPTYVFAGTVYSEYDEVDDCNGVEGVDVVVEDAEGSTWTMTTNAAGNFFLRASEADPVYPITALVRDGGAEHAMLTGQGSGDCASCHTAEGLEGAPGRVVVP